MTEIPKTNLSICEQVSFTRPDTVVLPTLQVTLEEPSPVTGKLNTITLHFPNGCNNLVEVTCFINRQQVLPINGFVALNDTIKEFPIHKSVNKKDTLRVIIANRDAVNPHTPSMIWNMEGTP